MPCYRFSDSELAAIRARAAQPHSEHGVVEDEQPQAKNEKKPKAKAVIGSTICDCGHPRDCHQQPRPAHPPLAPSTDMPCESNSGCQCQQFSVGGKPYRPRIAISDWTLCRGCGHPRHQHCTKKKPGLVKRLDPGELPYRILQKPGMSYGCRHFDPANPGAQCDSTACSASPDDKEFCPCDKFVNPWLTPKTKTAGKKRPPKKPANVSLAGAATSSTSETVPAKPRRSRKKKTAFTTGEMFPPETANLCIS
jgi:hypothetical protein